MNRETFDSLWKDHAYVLVPSLLKKATKLTTSPNLGAN